MARNPVPAKVLPVPVTTDDAPLELTPNTVALVTRFASISTGPAVRIRNAVLAPSTAFPASTIPGACGPTAKPELGWHHTVLPVTTASVAASRIATAVRAAHTWS